MPQITGEVLRAWRESRGWTVPETARRIVKAARHSDLHVASLQSVERYLYRWEAGRYIDEHYQHLLVTVLGLTSRTELAAGPHHTLSDGNLTPRPGMKTPASDRGTGTGRPGGEPGPSEHRWIVPSGAVEALRVAMLGDPEELDVAEDGLAELIRHYAHAVAMTPSPAVHDELLAARAFAGTLVQRARPAHPELIASAGWLSSLLAISACDLADHAAALVWCTDTERRAQQAHLPELSGWALLTKAVIAYYQGDALRSARLAQQGQATSPAGTVAYLKLAAQEMRSLAMLQDARGAAAARGRAVAARARLDCRRGEGVYSIPLAADPPYTATSLLLTGQYSEAEEITRQLVASGYASKREQERPSYARTLLILALTLAAQGAADEATSLGITALSSSPPAWPTLVLARRLNASLGKTPGADAAAFRDRYQEATRLLELAPSAQGHA